MMQPEDEPPKPVLSLEHPPLERLGVDELRHYLAGLRAEIGRAEAELARKEAVRTAADSVFRFG